MSQPSTPTYRLGDLLALARRDWIRRLSDALAAAGYPDYRRSDSVTLRLLRRIGPMPVGRLGTALGVTRQAARKVAAGLERRGFAVLERDRLDSRQLVVSLSADGQAYAEAITEEIERLNQWVRQHVTAQQLAGADAVLRAILVDDDPLVDHLDPPPGRTDPERTSP